MRKRKAPLKTSPQAQEGWNPSLRIAVKAALRTGPDYDSVKAALSSSEAPSLNDSTTSRANEP